MRSQSGRVTKNCSLLQLLVIFYKHKGRENLKNKGLQKKHKIIFYVDLNYFSLLINPDPGFLEKQDKNK